VKRELRNFSAHKIEIEQISYQQTKMKMTLKAAQG
jgi:hypothetical protein